MFKWRKRWRILSLTLCHCIPLPLQSIPVYPHGLCIFSWKALSSGKTRRHQKSRKRTLKKLTWSDLFLANLEEPYIYLRSTRLDTDLDFYRIHKYVVHYRSVWIKERRPTTSTTALPLGGWRWTRSGSNKNLVSLAYCFFDTSELDDL